MEEVARPFRVCVTGAESTGKSVLALDLAARFSAVCVPEYSREYAGRVGRALTAADVEPIARGQIDLQDRAVTESGILILDTDLLSTVVYSRHHYGSCPAWVEEAARHRLADLYLILDIDVPWIADPVRDTGATRERLHADFARTLREFAARYQRITGGWEERRQQAIEAIEGRERFLPGD